MTFNFKTISILGLLLFFGAQAQAQSNLVQNYSRLMEVSDIITMEASSSHLYVLSDEEGMAVFRTYPDSLQWLYTSTGMQRRGDRIQADIRFAYLFGDTRRLTVLEPTSVLGVYSSTVLPTKPRAAARLNNNLYIALGEEGLGYVSLETPETVDSDVSFVAQNEIGNASVLDLQSSDISKQLFVLTDAPSILVFNFREGNLNLDANIRLRSSLEKIFMDEDEIWGSTRSGEIYEVNSSGTGSRIGSVGESVAKILNWNNRLVVRSQSGKVWITDSSGNLEAWKEDARAGNFITNSEDRLWIAENNKIAEVFVSSDQNRQSQNASNNFSIKKIPNQVITYPNPLILSLELEGNYPTENVEFSYRSNTENAKIRKQGFVWQPTVNQVGNHWFRIIASNSEGKTDSTRFMVDVRSFNSPPRFTPVRTTSIAVNEKFTLNINATDPEDPNSDLIRYIGVDLPEGANIEENTGTFSWTPDERQVGETTFQVIATDKHGAASSMDVTLKVLDISRGSE